MKHYNKIYLFCLVVVILSSINWGIVGLANVSLFEVAISNKNVRYVIYMLIGLCALYLCFQKSLWYPEESMSVLPSKLITVSDPVKYTHIIKIKAKKGKKIVYWLDGNDDDTNYGAVIAEQDNFARIKLDIKDNSKDNNTKLYYRKYSTNSKIGEVKNINI